MEEELQKQERFRRIKHFFEVDTRIKKEMYNMVPPNYEGYIDERSLIEYTDKLDESLSYMYTELACVVSDFIGSKAATEVEALENQAKEEFYRAGTDIKKIREFYQNNISNMGKEFLDAVKENCVGYYMFRNLSQPIKEAHTVNEYLHLCHSVIMNNEGLLKALPMVATKKNNENYDISLRGEDVPEFRKVLDNFPEDIIAGDVDMVALSDKKMLMMVRDRGHALTIETTLENDKAMVEYFIPKLCNVDMVNALPGVNPVNEDSVGATGKFEMDRSTLSEGLNDFITKVPTDLDIVLKTR